MDARYYSDEEMLEKLEALEPGQVLFHKGHKPVPKVPGKVPKRRRWLDVKPDGGLTREQIRAAWLEVFAEKTPEERERIFALMRGE